MVREECHVLQRAPSLTRTGVQTLHVHSKGSVDQFPVLTKVSALYIALPIFTFCLIEVVIKHT